MGVSGSGKSTVGAALAQRLRVPFADADAFHPPANIAKMTSGRALDDDDRHPWLEAIVSFLHLSGSPQVIARRQASRPGHFMPASLLASQFETLERPDKSINAIVDDYVARTTGENA
jgi:gluconokinase